MIGVGRSGFNKVQISAQRSIAHLYEFSKARNEADIVSHRYETRGIISLLAMIAYDSNIDKDEFKTIQTDLDEFAKRCEKELLTRAGFTFTDQQ